MLKVTLKIQKKAQKLSRTSVWAGPLFSVKEYENDGIATQVVVICVVVVVLNLGLSNPDLQSIGEQKTTPS